MTPGTATQLVAAVDAAGRLDLLVNNASTLGASPLPALDAIDLDVLRRVYEVNVVAPLALAQQVLPDAGRGTRHDRQHHLRRGGRGVRRLGRLRIVEGRGRTVVGGAGGRAPDIRVLVVDPGDMRTEMHQDAFPGEDISDRPLPTTVAPGLVSLIESDHPSGRGRVAEVVS